MYNDRLPTHLYVEAHTKMLNIQAVPYYIHQKGDLTTGTIIVKINAFSKGCALYVQQRNLEGQLGWMDMNMTEERSIDDYIKRTIARDPDLWVIEVETSVLENPFEGEVF